MSVKEMMYRARWIRPLLLALCTATSIPISKGSIPWDLLIEESQKATLCYSISGITKDKRASQVGARSYACQPGEPLATDWPEKERMTLVPTKRYAELAQYQTSSWVSEGRIRIRKESGRLIVPNGINRKGLFQLRIACNSQNNQEQERTLYALTQNDWKRGMLRFCLNHIQNIEMNKDPELIRSSLAVAHWDNLMAEANTSTALTDHLLAALGTAIQSTQTFRQGRYPDVAIGLNKLRHRRFPGALVEEFVVCVPQAYENTQAWPVYLHTDRHRWAAQIGYKNRSGFIDIWWHTVADRDVCLKGYQAFMAILEKKLSIDKDRIYVEGDCANGRAAFALALNFPDQWAECDVVLTSNHLHMAGNALNLPFVFVRGGHREPELHAHYNLGLKCFQHKGVKHLKHSTDQSVAQARGTPLPDSIRESRPLQVSYTVDNLSAPRAYWVEITGRSDENLIATLEASVDNQQIMVSTANVDAYTLHLHQAPVDSSKPVEILENGRSLGFVQESVFTRGSGRNTEAYHVKNTSCHGPISDVFTDPLVVVYGLRGLNQRDAQSVKDLAEKLALGAGAPCLQDTDLPEEMFPSHNLVLIGWPGSNKWLTKVSRDLPLQVVNKQIRTSNGLVFDATDAGYMVIHPNPLNPKKYVAVFSATSKKSMNKMYDAYSQLQESQPVDVAMFHATDPKKLQWRIREKLDSCWTWHHRYDLIEGTLAENHPNWRWKQWAAGVVKEQMDADAVMCPFTMRDSDALAPGKLTLRDLFNAFHNEWFVKVQMTGKDLKRLVRSSLGTGLKKQGRKVPILAGLSLIEKPAIQGDPTLPLHKLGDSDLYTIALTEDFLNGRRTDLPIENYTIIKQTHFIGLLKQHLNTVPDIDFDRTLTRLQLNAI